MAVPGFCFDKTSAHETRPANWCASALQYYRGNNITGIPDALINDLQGSFVADTHDPSTGDLLTPTKTPVLFTKSLWDEAKLTASNNRNIRTGGKLELFGSRPLYFFNN